MKTVDSNWTSLPPQASVDYLRSLLVNRTVDIHISRHRKTKLGHFRPPQKGEGAVISVNGTLNSYSFLITFVHEIAHYYVWIHHGRKTTPHGVEWKDTFRKLMIPLLSENIFPMDVLSPLANYLKNPSASSNNHIELSRALMAYDDEQPPHMVESIPLNSTFSYGKGRIFKRMEKKSKRIVCQEIKTGKKYTFHPLTPVNPIDI